MLRWWFRMGCLIDEGESFLMTGGYSEDSGQSGRVTRYDRHGLVRRLNNLQEGRAGHGCTQFINNDGIKVGIFSFTYKWILIHIYNQQVNMVAGGLSVLTRSSILSYEFNFPETSDAWTVAGDMPLQLSWFELLNFDNRIILIGKNIAFITFS